MANQPTEQSLVKKVIPEANGWVRLTLASASRRAGCYTCRDTYTDKGTPNAVRALGEALSALVKIDAWYINFGGKHPDRVCVRLMPGASRDHNVEQIKALIDQHLAPIPA